MSGWDIKRFKDLEDQIIATLSGHRPVIDVPYFLFPYDPSLELRCLKECNLLLNRLKAKGFSSEVISLSNLFLNACESLECLQAGIGEKSSLTDDLERELPDIISKYLISALGKQDISHCAILTRAASLFPLVHISSLLSKLEGYVKCVVLLPYPGSKAGRELSFMNETYNSYYRAEIV